MKKRFIICLLTLMMASSTACATILPATGVNKEFLAWTGIETTPAVQLCQSLSVCDERDGRVLETRLYSGAAIPVIEYWDGWAKIYYSDGNKTGWVRSHYLAFDPAWYVCDESTQVYAYPDPMSPRVALLDAGEKLAIITETEEWVCVSLRAASGWIKKRPADTVSRTWFRPEMLEEMVSAELKTGSGAAAARDAQALAALREMLTSVSDLGGPMAGCPFTATLTVTLADGRALDLQIATDSCCVYRVDGRDYQYARHLKTGDAGVSNDVFFDLFETYGP